MRNILLGVVAIIVIFVLYKGPSAVVGLLQMSRKALPPAAGQENILNRQPAKTGKKVLVAYFSWGGNTRAVARSIQGLVGGDLYEIIPAVAYPTGYKDTIVAAKRERESAEPIKLAGTLPELKDYDYILLGYPIWWNEEPPAIKAFLLQQPLNGKTIIPFATSGSSDIKNSVQSLRKLLPTVDIKDGLLANMSSKVEPWLRQNGML